MGRGRAPCCDKSKVKKGPWSPGEDLRLISFIQKHGHGNWRALPKQAGLLRCGKSCRLRWINYLRPDVKRGNFSPEEEETIIGLHKSIGNKWSKIASHLPGRTDNEIKNVWNTHLKKRLGRADADFNQNETMDSVTSYSASPSPSSSSCISYGDANLDKVPGDPHMEGQESIARTVDDPKQELILGQCKPVVEQKEASASPNHSYASNVEETGLLFDKTEQATTDEAANTHEVFDIPWEIDIDFWNILDSFDAIQASESQPLESDISNSLNFGEEFRGEVEYKKWLRYLENELGLAGGTDGDCQRNGAEQQQLAIKTSETEMIYRPEIDPTMAYFSMWPSSPQNFGI